MAVLPGISRDPPRAPAAGGPWNWVLDLEQPYDGLRRRALTEAAALRGCPPGSARTHLVNLILFVCAAEQVAADYLVEGALDLSSLRGRNRLVDLVAGLLEGASAGAAGVRSRTWRRHTASVVESLRALALDLATRLAASQLAGLPDSIELARRFPEPGDQGLGERRLKVPTCFRSEDLDVDDCFELARRFAASGPVRGRVLVAGVRTSGSYMAPLCAGWLRSRGVDAGYTTVRPKAAHVWSERRAIRRFAPAAALVVDDPPMTGAAYVRTARRLEACRIRASQISLLVPLSAEIGSSRFRIASFDRYPRFELASEDLAVRRRLESPATVDWLREVTGRPRAQVTAIWDEAEVAARASRAHVQQLYHVEGFGRVLVKGIGTHWFGHPAAAAAVALRECTVQVLGVRWGLMAMCWEAARGEPSDVEMAAYVAARAARLAIPPRHPGRPRKDGYYRLAKMLARVHGPLAPLRISSVRSALIEGQQPGPACLVDGRMDPDRWLRTRRGTVKCDFDEHAFDKDDLEMFDPAYDLAGALLELGPSRRRRTELVEAYARGADDSTVSDRLPLAALLYGAFALERTVWQVAGEAGRPAWGTAVERWLRAEAAMTWALDTLMADACPAEPPAAMGPPVVWALDVDGVLEDGCLGVPSTTPAGVAAIREMRAAGATIVLNTGRSLEEVRLRCDALGLDGGVAEYGAVLWDHRRRAERPLISEIDRDALERVRDAAARLPGVHVDTRYRRSVRLRQLAPGGLRQLDRELVDRLLEAGRGRVAAVAGARQTDFVATACDKGSGLRALVEWLELKGGVMAMGDAEADLPAFLAADRAFAPRHHDEVLEAAGQVLRSDRQAAVLEAARLIHGDRPGSRPAPTALVGLLGLRDRPRWLRAVRAANLRALDVFRT